MVAVAPTMSLSGLAPYVALAAPVFVLYLVRSRLQVPVVSPPWAVVAIFSVIGALGYAFHASLALAGGASVVLTMNDELAAETAYLFAIFNGAIVLGVLAVVAWRKPRPRERLDLHPPAQGLVDLGLTASALLVATGWVLSGERLLLRPEHLVGSEGGSIATLTGTVGIGAVAVCGYLFASQIGLRKAVAFAVVAAYFILFFAASSRRLALLPVLFAVGYFVHRRSRRGWYVLLAALVASALLLPLPLYLRGLPMHGLEPYLERIGDFSYGDVDWMSSINNVLVSFPITAHSAFREAPHPSSWLWIELNPLPGRMVGWYDIAPSLRLNRFTPFSTLGGLGNYGTTTVIGVGLGLGAVLAYLDGRVSTYLATGWQFLAVGLVGMAGFVSVSALQYNLRTSSRLLLYALLIDIAARVVLANRANKAAELHPTWEARERTASDSVPR